MDKFFKRFSSFSIIFAAVLWGIIGLFVRTLSAYGLNSLEIMMVRCFFSAGMIFVYLGSFDRKSLKVRPRDLWMFFGTGIVSFLIFGCAYFAAINLTSMSVAAVLLYTSPVFVMLMAAVFFKEKITRLKILSITICVVGCVLVTGGLGGAEVSAKGIFYGLVSGFCYALYSIFGRIAAKNYNAVTVTAYTFLFAAGGSFFAADLPKTAGIIIANPALILLCALFALVSAVLPYIFYTGGLKYTPAGKAAVMACVEPVVASMTGVVIFRESMSVQAFCGAVLILGAIALQNLHYESQKS